VSLSLTFAAAPLYFDITHSKHFVLVNRRKKPRESKMNGIVLFKKIFYYEHYTGYSISKERILSEEEKYDLSISNIHVTVSLQVYSSF